MEQKYNTEVRSGDVRLRVMLSIGPTLLSAYFPEEGGEPSWAGSCDLDLPQKRDLIPAMEWYAETHCVEHLAALVCDLQRYGRDSYMGKLVECNLTIQICAIIRDYIQDKHNTAAA